jgi:phosphohistidine phosphatase
MAQKMDVSVTEIRHSGKTRARQTAGILGNYVEPQKGVREAEGLGPVDDVQPIGDQITQDQQDVMLVGHLPFMERLAGYLLTGDADQKVIDFQNAGIVSLALEEGQWIVNWIATPAMFL